MLLISFCMFLCISIMSMIQLCFIKEFFNKIMTFFYFSINFITFLLVYFVYSNKFGFIIQIIFPLIILNMSVILLFIKSKIGGDRK